MEVDGVRKYRPLKISRNAITGVSPDKPYFMPRRAFTFSYDLSAKKERPSSPKKFAPVIMNSLGKYKGLNEQLQTRSK